MKRPKLCVPLTGRTREEIDEQLIVIVPKQPDLIELRADFLYNIDNVEYVLSIVENVIKKSNIPLLFTIRSEREGGEPIHLTEEEKVTLLAEVSSQSDVTYVDYEVQNSEQYVRQVKEAVDDNDKQLILSYHNFNETPKNNELIKQFVHMEMYGAHMAKVAVMPNSKKDVLRLLHLTKEVDELLSIPVMTMSMGDLGKYSRLMGWIYGCALTFGVGVESSAPGTIPIDELRYVNDEVGCIIE